MRTVCVWASVMDDKSRTFLSIFLTLTSVVAMMSNLEYRGEKREVNWTVSATYRSPEPQVT